MVLPSDAGGRVTETVGYFDFNAMALADWLRHGLDGPWALSSPGWTAIEDAVADLAPAPTLSRYAFVPIGSWAILLNNGPLGTDVGVLPSHAARELHCRAIRVVSVGDQDEFPARLIEVYGPDGVSPLALERSIVCARDGDRWVFETAGEPFPFEDLAAYSRPKKSSRLSPELILGYLRALGVPLDTEPDWRAAAVVGQS